MTALTDVLSDQRRKASLEKRFWPKVKQGKPTECWPWVAKAAHPFGYGRMTAGRGVNLKAHQISWALKNGPIPVGMKILHSCDNPPCCNPDHLFCGTMRDNTLDMMKKGRGSVPPIFRGETSAMSKLTAEIILSIRSSPRSMRALATEHGVSAQTIFRIRHKKAWAHI